MAVQSPLLETSINGAKGVLVNVTGSIDLALEDVEIAANLVQQAAHPDANIIFGASFDDSLEDEIRITVIATNFNTETGAPEKLYTEVSKVATAAAAPPPAEKKVEPVSTPAAPQDEEEDPFEKIFQIFNKK